MNTFAQSNQGLVMPQWIHHTSQPRPHLTRVLLAVLLALVMQACSSPRSTPAPVEDKKAINSQGVWINGGLARMSSSNATPLGAENAGKPGYYTVKQGDTLIRIGLDQGQNWRDIVKWNNLDNPNNIEVGQVLRVQAPNAPALPSKSKEQAATGVVVKPVRSPALQTPSNADAVTGPSPMTKPPAAETASADEISFSWPATGNLIIIKHNNTYLSAYAHNQTLLVKEDQSIKRGQKIAEMGSTDTDQVKLHFEVRRQGKPIDPLKMLPAR